MGTVQYPCDLRSDYSGVVDIRTALARSSHATASQRSRPRSFFVVKAAKRQRNEAAAQMAPPAGDLFSSPVGSIPSSPAQRRPASGTHSDPAALGAYVHCRVYVEDALGLTDLMALSRPRPLDELFEEEPVGVS